MSVIDNKDLSLEKRITAYWTKFHSLFRDMNGLNEEDSHVTKLDFLKSRIFVWSHIFGIEQCSLLWECRNDYEEFVKNSTTIDGLEAKKYK